MGLEISPARGRAWHKAQKREEQEWAKRSGPVTVYLDPTARDPGAGTSTEGQRTRKSRAAASRTAKTRRRKRAAGDRGAPKA